jgi:predicted glutamine amidotransferase
MCRIFFLLNSVCTNNIKNPAHSLEQKIKDFLKQSHHSKKNTPGINNPRDHLTHPDGFGLAWQNAGKKWIVYKTPQKYTDISDLDETIQTIEKNDKVVIGHIRMATDSEPAIENTHPFLYKNQLFLQNGYIADFAKHKETLIEFVAPDLLKHIKGDTDTEVLFFMFLTIKRKIQRTNEKNEKNETTESILVESIRELFRIFEDKNIEISANLIYAEKEHVVITRYMYYDKSKYKHEQIPPSLYYDTSDGLLITSEPITPKFKPIASGTIIVIDIENIQFTAQAIV